jgi:peptide-methionine (S)-S-oxide reductase
VNGPLHLAIGLIVILAICFGAAVATLSFPGAFQGTEINRTEQGYHQMQKATFGAGCFWGVEAAFRQVEGVLSTAVGYCGGTLANPTYEDVCSHGTGHAEVVQVEFDPTKVAYEELLEVFWKNHDPTQMNRQGPDVGSQYRSAIFFHNPEQETAAKASKERLEKRGKYRKPIVTEIMPASTFYRAEEYHQQYLEKRGLSSCHL